MACTWDTLGGQMGYNSLGNITFFGVGMYVSAIVQISSSMKVVLVNTPRRWVRSNPNSPTMNILQGCFWHPGGRIGGLVLSVLFSSFMFGCVVPISPLARLVLPLPQLKSLSPLTMLWRFGHFHAVVPRRHRIPITFFYILCFVAAAAAHFCCAGSTRRSLVWPQCHPR